MSRKKESHSHTFFFTVHFYLLDGTIPFCSSTFLFCQFYSFFFFFFFSFHFVLARTSEFNISCSLSFVAHLSIPFLPKVRFITFYSNVCKSFFFTLSFSFPLFSRRVLFKPNTPSLYTIARQVYTNHSYYIDCIALIVACIFESIYD